MPQKVLIIEDEPAMALGLRDNLEAEGYEVLVSGDGEHGLREAIAKNADLVLLDIMLPKLNGLEVCQRLRAQGFSRPILMLTARGQEIDKVAGLETGADDYITKPFGLRELLARVRAHLRRESRKTTKLETYEFGDVYLDFRKHVAERAGKPIPLSPREFDLLHYLIQNRGEAVTRDELLDSVWGLTNYPITRTVDNHVAKLRQRVDDPGQPRYIITVHKVGYKFLG